MRVGFLVCYSPQEWMGGINYLKSLFRVVQSHFPDKYEFFVYVGHEGSLEAFRDSNVVCRYPRFLRRYSLSWILRVLGKVLFGRDFLMESLVRRDGIRVMSHTDPWSPTSSVAFYAWIPDFQPLKMPEFFPAKSVRRFARALPKIIEHSHGIFVSSQCALNDLVEACPVAQDKSKILRFVCQQIDITNLPSLDFLVKNYGIRRDFIFLPNQFWAHKNHKVVIQGLELLRKAGFTTQVVCTGNPFDHRAKGHFATLLELICFHNLQDEFKILGLIPYSHVMGLLNHSRALVNPSLFEGWATTVEEGKSLGKKMILSDIPIHREQCEGWRSWFFDPGSPQDFANASALALNDDQPIHFELVRARYAESARSIAIDYDRSLERFERTLG